MGSSYWLNKRTHSVPAVFHFNGIQCTGLPNPPCPVFSDAVYQCGIGGGKVHHLQMEAQLWYKRSDVDAAEKKAKLAARRLQVISEAHRAPLRFKDICSTYLQT